MPGRPPGSKNRLMPGDVGYDPTKNKPGRKARGSFMPRLSDESILKYKTQILELLSSEEVTTVSEAARILKLNPAKVHNWASNDKDFQEMIKLTREVIADDIEKRLRDSKHFIPQMFLLKAYRPMFRENYKLDLGSSKMEELLMELKKLGQKKESPSEVPDRDSTSSPTGQN